MAVSARPDWNRPFGLTPNERRESTMSTSSIVGSVRAPRSFLAVLALAGAAGSALGQVNEAPFPTSSLTTLNPSTMWQGWGMGGFGYGGGSNLNGSSGQVGHISNFLGQTELLYIGIAELRNSYSPFHSTDPHQRHYGQVEFTAPSVVPYTISGSVTLVMTGSNASSSSAVGQAMLEVVGGPTLATYGGSMNRSSSVSVINSVFDASAPLSGSSSGLLWPGFTYRFRWDYLVTSQVNGDTTLNTDIYGLLGPSYMQISFVPAPGAAALLGLGGLLATRRRRAT